MSLYNKNMQAQLLILIICANVTLNTASYVIVREKGARKVHDTTEPCENLALAFVTVGAQMNRTVFQ